MYTFVMYILCPISTLIHPKVCSMDTGNSDGKLNMGNDGRVFKKIGSEWDDLLKKKNIKKKQAIWIETTPGDFGMRSSWKI